MAGPMLRHCEGREAAMDWSHWGGRALGLLKREAWAKRWLPRWPSVPQA